MKLFFTDTRHTKAKPEKNKAKKQNKTKKDNVVALLRRLSGRAENLRKIIDLSPPKGPNY